MVLLLMNDPKENELVAERIEQDQEKHKLLAPCNCYAKQCFKKI